MYELSNEFLLSNEFTYYRCNKFFIDIWHDKEILIQRDNCSNDFEYHDSDECGFDSLQFKSERDLNFALDEFCNSILTNRNGHEFDISGIGISIDEFEIKRKLLRKLNKDITYNKYAKYLLKPFRVSKPNNIDNTYVFNCEFSAIEKERHEVIKTVIVDGKEYSRKEDELIAAEPYIINIDVMVQFIITKSHLQLYSRR